MAYLLPTLVRAVLGQQPKLVCSRRIWNNGIDELRRRSEGRRESGAFLLGHTLRRTRRITTFLFYDDVDPTCFSRGIVEFNGNRFGAVWERCRLLGVSVVADVHVHPGHYAQSSSDRHNPMIPQRGHLAIIIPDYAARGREPDSIGIYEYLGRRRWFDHSLAGNRTFHIGWWSWLRK